MGERVVIGGAHPSWSRRARRPTHSLPADQFPTCDHGVVGDAGPADAVVPGARHLSGAAGAVAVEPVVGVPRVGVGVVAAEVVARPGILQCPGVYQGRFCSAAEFTFFLT